MELKIVSKGIEYTCLYDDADHELVSKFRWSKSQHGYAETRRNDKLIRMHRLLLGVTDRNVLCDHKNRNKLDNQRSNLRITDYAGNSKNKTSFGKSKYLGVFINKVKGYDKICIYSRIKSNGVDKYLGSFPTEEEAARAYDKAAMELHGEFASINFKDSLLPVPLTLVSKSMASIKTC